MANKSIEDFLRIGEVVLVQAKPLHGPICRFRTAVRGWHSQVRIILDRPTFPNNVDPLHEGCACTVRFLHEGTACAFRSALSNWHVLSESHWFHVGWPYQFEAVSFRKSPRLTFNIPCTVDLEGSSAPGILRDISSAGCGVALSQKVDAGVQLGLNFRLPTGASINQLRSVVRNTRVMQQQTVAGCEFLPEQPVTQNQIAEFINTMLGRKGGSSNRRRVLIVDSNPDTSAGLCRKLIDKGCDAYFAASAVDGFARLSVLNPVAVVVRLDLGDLPGEKFIQLVKQDEDYLTTPVFAFSDCEDLTPEGAADAGACAYFQLESDTGQLCEAVSALCMPD